MENPGHRHGRSFIVLKFLRMTPFGRLARRARWSLSPRSESGALHGRLSLRAVPPIMETKTAATWVIRVENHSRQMWQPAGPARVVLRHRWITRTGSEFGAATEVPLPRTLLPGDWADISAIVEGPAAVGDFTLAWDLTAAGKPIDGVPGEEVPVHVTFPRAADIDYHHVYRTADLTANSWWVVGAYHSQDEYLRSSRARRDMLIDCGLTPDSRVLDIGCGTGQMAMALEDYLSDRGAYYGTDIGREAIDYCRRTYRRPSFVFAAGEMTRVPFADSDGPFDLAVFFSVFTHTFADESVLLLAEARRLLGPQGGIVADVIASDLVSRAAGNRGQMWVNAEHFIRLAESLGFRARRLGTSAWAAHAERIMFHLRRAG
jgi:SAM-dependent methyltransferase